MYGRPGDLFDREGEWQALARFAGDEAPGATLGLVSGRRRQGKTFLLQALCEAAGGFYHQAIEATEAEALRHLGAEVARHHGLSAALSFPDWSRAFEALLDLGGGLPRPVVIDEFPYLCRASPPLPSVLQAALAPRSARRSRSRTRLLLCGSALSFMGRLLGGDSPLRGRAGLELVVSPFDYRTAADFWGLRRDPEVAFRVHAIVGGTPAYRREFVRNEAPTRAGDFDRWVADHVLNPAMPLFREARYLLAEESDLRDPGLYHSILSAIAEGCATRGKIAAALQRSSTDMGHSLRVLEDMGFISRERDILRPRRPLYRIREPLVRFYHGVMRPAWGRLQLPGRGAQVWQESQETFRSAILGPHFEELAREWVRRHAGEELLDEAVEEAGATTITDRRGRTSHQVDVVAFGRKSGRQRRLLLVGEAKLGREMDLPDLERLQHIRELLAAHPSVDASASRLACISGGGFSRRLRRQARTDAVALIGFGELYGR